MGLLIHLYDEIKPGLCAVVLSKLAEDLQAAVEVRINSPGGDLAEGLAIFNALRQRKPTVYIDGVAASSASVIAMAGERIIAADNALVMIHDPWASMTGNAGEFRKTADRLDKARDAMLNAYARTGLSRAKVLELCAAETWMSAEEALALGFVDEINEGLRYAAHARECFASYKNTPEELLMNTNARGVRAADPAQQQPNSPAPAIGDDPEKTLEAFRKGLGSESVSKAAYDAVLTALKDRNEEIMAMAQAAELSDPRIREYTMQALADPTVTREAFGARVLTLMSRGREPLNGRVGMRASGGGPAGSDFLDAASDALAIRAGVRLSNPHVGVRDLSGMSMTSIAGSCIRRAGRSMPLNDSPIETIKAALTTSDFPKILENSIGKALRSGFESEPATYEAWTRKVLVRDFKEQSRVLLGAAPDLLPVAEGGEYKYGALDEDAAIPYRVNKFGRLIKLTWEALVNDDLGAFMRIPQALGQAAQRAEGDAIYGTFAENSGAGPTMQDGKALFHADHGNIAASAAGITAGALGAARVLLRRQTGTAGGVLNLSPRFLLVPPELEQDAEALLAAASRGITTGAANEILPAWLGKMDLVVEARLPDDAFYVLTDPAGVDTYERGWLEVDNGPVVEEHDSFNIDAKSYKIRHVFGGRWLDWRGAVKVPVT